jgi:hypothetical protein
LKFSHNFNKRGGFFREFEKTLNQPFKKVKSEVIESVLIDQYRKFDIGIDTGALINSHWVRKESNATILKWGNFQSYAEFVNNKKPWLTDDSTISSIFNQIQQDFLI